MHPASRKGPLLKFFLQKNIPHFPLFYKTPPISFLAYGPELSLASLRALPRTARPYSCRASVVALALQTSEALVERGAGNWTLRVTSSCVDLRDAEPLSISTPIKPRSASVVLLTDHAHQLAATHVTRTRLEPCFSFSTKLTLTCRQNHYS